ncbi:hypothetical protein [Burkholderia anthina]|uniref:hypothetical protein n=1 Tax=Burkholderia anthina TaxID=179879 RepID=UPI00158CC9D6|nr:hypothetical protein [Burkholderia anthina]
MTIPTRLLASRRSGNSVWLVVSVITLQTAMVKPLCAGLNTLPKQVVVQQDIVANAVTFKHECAPARMLVSPIFDRRDDGFISDG